MNRVSFLYWLSDRRHLERETRDSHGETCPTCLAWDRQAIVKRHVTKIAAQELVGWLGQTHPRVRFVTTISLCPPPKHKPHEWVAPFVRDRKNSQIRDLWFSGPPRVVSCHPLESQMGKKKKKIVAKKITKSTKDALRILHHAQEHINISEV